ncbi:glycosyltransferase family 4 protein [Tateyamaria omphalii]|uniref:glycosyltransferase family 4 protein n=1 Tax=Tateyamaria omphalii TaxID=299262 RepID=UPI001C991BCA|nr:glycosyltransferase family 4 protein [Tateyamaria omphalii]MBY5932201.1 glycosyltransferase family 4 protein [Tateyamaria omphalii]
MPDLAQIDVIAPNFKRRLSGVTATVARLVPLQAQSIAITACAPEMPEDVPNVHWSQLLTMPGRGPSGPRVWHARRNVEMIAGLALRGLLGKRLKLLFTSASQRHHTGLTKALIRRMDAVIATSAKTAGYLERPATVIHHGIDTELFAPRPDKTALRTELGLPSGPLMGCFGRIRAQKGTDVFVDAMIQVLGNHPEAAAIVMGRAVDKDQAFLDDLQSRVEAAGLTDRLLFLPEVPVWETPRFYQALDIYIAPQRWEGFGLTPLEAMACGAPAIATRVGAFEELVKEGETGTLIDAGNVDQMVAATHALLSDPDRLALWSAQARNHMVDHFQLKQEADAIIAIYQDLLSAS